MYEIDLDSAQKIIEQIARDAGEILKKYFASGDFTSISKGSTDFLTQADQEADDFIKKSLSDNFPDCPILTEESAPDDYSSLKNLDNLWVVDPLDGTSNFSRGSSYFAVSIGLVDKGVSKLAVVYLPMEDKIYLANANQNHATCNGKPINVSRINSLNETVFDIDFGWIIGQRDITLKWMASLVTKIRQIKIMGSAASELALLAEGKIDVYLHSGLKPWDTAASSLLVEKAGGKITTPQGEKWNIFNPQMLASNGILHDTIIELINQ